MLQKSLDYCLFLADLPTLLWELTRIVAIRTETESLVPLFIISFVVFHIVDNNTITGLHTLSTAVRAVIDFPHLWVSLTVDNATFCVPDDIPDEILPIH
jgi:hypothetical protein